MEVVGVTASALAILELSCKVGQYLTQAKDAREDRKRIRDEIQACEVVLRQIQRNADQEKKNACGPDSKWQQALAALEKPGTPFYRIYLNLKTIHAKLEPKEGHGHGSALKWPFHQKEIDKLLSSLQRERSLLNLALTDDCRVILREMQSVSRENTQYLLQAIETVKATTHHSHNYMVTLTAVIYRLQNSHALLMDNVDTLVDHQLNSSQQAILNWLTPFNPGAKYSDLINRRQEGTGQWLLNSTKFQHWVNTPHQTLFCPEIPGAGKTILSSTIIQYLLELAQSNTNLGVAYVHFSFKRRNEQRERNIIASVLKQLCQCTGTVPEIIKGMHMNHMRIGTRPSTAELLAALKLLASSFSRVYFVLDALDEFHSVSCRWKILSHLSNLRDTYGSNILATARLIPDIEEDFEEYPSLEIHAQEEDVRMYVSSHLHRLPHFVRHKADLQREATAKIAVSVEGMFLLAEPYLDSLVSKRSRKTFIAATNEFHTGSKGHHVYDQAYSDTMERINDQPLELATLALHTLMWITCSRRPLTSTELQHALAIEVGKKDLDEENISEIDTIISACAGLVTVDKQSNIVQLVHYTAQEYFERNRDQWFRDADSGLIISIFTYLSFSLFSDGACADDEFLTRSGLYPFYRYAACNWGYHAEILESPISELVEFLSSENLVSASFQRLKHDEMFPFPGSIRPSSIAAPEACRATGLHLAAPFSLYGATEVMLKKYHADVLGPDRRTALTFAVEGGDVDIVNLLLYHGANIDGYPGDYPPLTLAAECGNEDMVKMLLDKGANVDGQPTGSHSPLLTALHLGKLSMAETLIERDASVCFPKNTTRTPLISAIRARSQELVRLLLKKGASLDERDITSFTPLMVAAYTGVDEIMAILFQYGARAECVSNRGARALMFAISHGHDACVQLLVENGANIHCQDGMGRTALSCAVEKDSFYIISLLLAKGAVVNSQCGGGKTPLHYSMWAGDPSIISILLRYGADIDSQDEEGIAPLHLAVSWVDIQLVELLLLNGASVDIRDTEGTTPLGVASSGCLPGCEKMCQILLDRGADPNVPDNSGKTPFMMATERGDSYMTNLMKRYSGEELV